MVDTQNKDIKRYLNIWEDIAKGGIPYALQDLKNNKDQYIGEMIQKVRDSFKRPLDEHLHTLHEVTNDAHYLRNIIDVTLNPLLSLKGLKYVKQQQS